MAQQHTAGRAELCHNSGLGGVPAAEQDECALAGVVLVIGVVIVLDEKGNAVQRSAHVALPPLGVHGVGDAECIGVDFAYGVSKTGMSY